MPTLYQLNGSAVIRVLTLTNGVFTIGRGTDNDLVLADAEVSRHHCRLTVTHGRTVIEDLRSRNGTWLADDCPREPTALRNGERFRVGSSQFVYRDDAVARMVASIPSSGSVTSSRPMPGRKRREEFRFRIRWHFDWSGFAFGWKIRRA